MGRLKENLQVLFKNSNNTFNTYSKTCSAFSESITKSIVMQLKKKIQNKNYYNDNGTVKRDLSIETDICILRRYLKENKRRIQNRNSSLARFKYSINNTNKDTFDESKADISACGDSQSKFENAQLKVDLTTLVVDNLKTLLNDWIKKYLLENNNTKQKIATVLDSILHKFELEQTSSSGTYTLDVELINEAVTNDSTTTRNNYGRCLKRNSGPKISSMTVPLTRKRIKLISTLSIPKISSKYTKTKTKRTHVHYNKASINKLLSNSSSCNVLEIRTESFTKRCATYQKPKWEKSDINNKFNFNPQSITTITSVQSNDKNDDMETVEGYTGKEFKSDSTTFAIDRLEKENILDILPAIQNKPVIVNQYKKHCNKKFKRKIKVTKQHKITFQNIKAKSFSYRCKKPSNKFTRHGEFLKSIESILKYFEKMNYAKNIKLDIQVNITPDIIENENNGDIKKSCTINNNENKTTLLYNVEPKNVKSIDKAFNNHLTNQSSDGLKIISLLDGAISQTKYLISRQISMDKSNKKIEIEKSIKDQQTGTSGLEIVRDLVEIKKIIKDLVCVAESVIKDHIDKKNISPNVKYISEASKKSIAVQCLNTETKNVLTSGLKLKKEPKQKGTKDYNPRLIKRSTSYQIIESESVLEIHDLTLPKNNVESMADEVLPAITLPKSQSVLKITPTVHNRKILAFYCDKCIKSRQCIYSACNHNVPCANMYPTYCENDCQNIKHKNIEHFCNAGCPEDRRQLMECNFDNCRIISRQNCNDAEEDATSVYLDIDRTTCDKKIVITKRSVGFKEGCLYCTILWIPLLVIMWYFYTLILKEFIESKTNTLKSPLLLFANNNSSEYPISITDLGF